MSRNIGQYRHRVTVQASTITQDATTGEEIKAWATAATPWARVRPLSGREYLQAEQVEASASHEISFLSVSGLTTSHRILWGTRVFDINHINDLDERGIEQRCICTESV